MCNCYILLDMITPEQCRSARAWLDWSQEDLAVKANVSLSTVRDYEKGRRVPIANNIVAMEAALERAGMYPIVTNGEPGGVRYEPRIKERDTYLPMLELLDEAKDGFMPTADIIKALEMVLGPKGPDAEILEGRSDSRFSQIVRNVVSHRETPTNPIHLGWIDYDKAKRGLRITSLGRAEMVEMQKAKVAA